MGTRHSPRPLYFWASGSSTTRALSAPRDRENVSEFARRHCEERSDEAIHSSFARRHGLLRGACHRARIRATRWLAMTDMSWLFENRSGTLPTSPCGRGLGRLRAGFDILCLADGADQLHREPAVSRGGEMDLVSL